VTGLRCGQGDERAAGQARALAALALQHLRAGAVRLVLVGGLPGTGKSTLAAKLAARFGWTVLSSDRIRKELAGIPARQPCPAAYGTGLYTPEWTERTYNELLRRADLLLGSGEPVIADASWTAPGQRSAATAVAERAAADLAQLRCTVPAGLAEQRLRSRTHDLSDADPQISKQMAAAEGPWPEAITIDTTSADDSLERAIKAVRPPSPEDMWLPTRPYMQPG
jgi:predicted kinase